MKYTTYLKEFLKGYKLIPARKVGEDIVLFNQIYSPELYDNLYKSKLVKKTINPKNEVRKFFEKSLGDVILYSNNGEYNVQYKENYHFIDNFESLKKTLYAFESILKTDIEYQYFFKNTTRPYFAMRLISEKYIFDFILNNHGIKIIPITKIHTTKDIYVQLHPHIVYGRFTNYAEVAVTSISIYDTLLKKYHRNIQYLSNKTLKPIDIISILSYNYKVLNRNFKSIETKGDDLVYDYLSDFSDRYIAYMNNYKSIDLACKLIYLVKSK